MIQKAIHIPSGKLSLSGYEYVPDSAGRFPGVILLHPHPLYGGSMSNTVIRAAGTALVKANIAAIMFNFRGVGKSTGSFGEGKGESDDVLAVLGWLTLQPYINTGKIGLCGYSFGGGIAASVGCLDDRVSALALISPFFVIQNNLHSCHKPKLFLMGERDDAVSLKAIDSAFISSPRPKEIRSYPQADHFWFGCEDAMVQDVVDFFVKHLATGDGNIMQFNSSN